MSETPVPKQHRDRSPSYPFVSLRTAMERVVAFDAYFKRHPAPIDKVGLAWGMKEKSSQAGQTCAALRSFGLMTDMETDGTRQVALSTDARMYLRVQQQGLKQEVLKRAALRPKVIQKFWSIWGDSRPPDPIALDELMIRNGFSERGAPIFLEVYDETISYAGLSDSDKERQVEEGLGEEEAGDEAKENPLPHPPPQPRLPPSQPREHGRVAIMEDERELTTGLLSKDASFRLIVSGKVGEKEIERLIRKLELDKEILAEATEGDGQEAGSPG